MRRQPFDHPARLKSGRISGQRDELGAWLVEPVELHRVFPEATAEAAPRAVPQDAQADAQVAALLAQLAEMRAQRDAWQGIAERLTSALPKPYPNQQRGQNVSPFGNGCLKAGRPKDFTSSIRRLRSAAFARPFRNA